MIKKLLTLFAVILLVSCKDHRQVNSVENPNPSFDYLLGNWARTNDEPGQKTFESWTKSNDTVYNGISYTLKESDTIWREDVKLSKSGKRWNFSVLQKGQKDPTIFKVERMEKSSFVCTNATNDFPKRIEYRVNHDKIHALISGDGPEKIGFNFDRLR